MSISPIGNSEQIDISDIDSVDDIDNVALFDSQVEVELEQLSSATDRIKKIESELDQARSDFTCFLGETSAKVKSFSKKLGCCVEKAKKCREVGMQVRELLSEAESSNELEHESILHKETEKIVHQLQQELKKSINKSCLSTRRSLLQLNNLANQHQLQLLPYFEMKNQFNQMFEEQMKKVPPLEDSDWKLKDIDENFQLETSSERFQDITNDERCNGVHSKATNSLTSSYHDSFSSEKLYLEHLTSEDVYLDLPPSINITPGLVNCTVSCRSNGYYKSSRHYSTDGESFEDLNHRTNHERNSLDSNGFQCSNETLQQLPALNNVNDCPTDGSSSVEDFCSNTNHESFSIFDSNCFLHDSMNQMKNSFSNDALNKMSEINDMLTDKKSSDSESSILNLNSLLTDVDEMSESDSLSSNDQTKVLDIKQV